MIVQEKAWSRRKDFLVFKKQHLNPILNPPQPAPAQASGANDSVLAEQLVAAMNNDKNCDRIEAYYKVTSSSDKCALIIRFISQCGTDSWVFKPDMLAEVFNKWTEVMEVSCTLLFEALANMQSGKASDPDSSDKNTPLVTIYNPPNDPKKQIQLHVERAFTFITIPCQTLKTEEAEKTWLNANITKVLRGIRDAMNTPLFRMTLERLGQGRRQGYINKLHNPAQKSNLPKFLNACKIRCEPIGHITDHVIQVVSNNIMTHLWQHKLSGPKCTQEPQAQHTNVQDIPNEDFHSDDEDSDEDVDPNNAHSNDEASIDDNNDN